LRPRVVPELPRQGEDPSDCGSRRKRDEGSGWTTAGAAARSGAGVPLVLMLPPRDDHDLTDLSGDLVAEMGDALIASPTKSRTLPNLSRCHVGRIADEGARCPPSYGGWHRPAAN
jgi:hypothetical protein